ncbi:cell division protein FtsX [Parvularcula oceani]|uniref:cell division protein FtsX n=1 Tax=Parvularcula oceani TaxID=1247963 RepID=UPI0006895E19|nr:FtsX-like permease family protein [Parvularcula oceani]
MSAPQALSGREAGRRAAPLLPEAGAAGTPLMIVIAILAFMAGIALIANFVVSRAVAEWTGDLTGTVTIQVKGANPADIAQQAAAVEELLRDRAGVNRIARLSRAETERLLEPWLGRDNLTEDIPVPALLTADVTPQLRRDLGALRSAVAEVAPDASLDDHGAFNDRLVAAADRMEALAFLVFAMVMTAAAAVIIFATRAGLAANSRIVEVLHLVGATDDFVAGQVQRRYFSLALRGGAAGAAAAAFILFAAASFGGEGDGFFLPSIGADPAMLAWLAIVPLLLCVVATLTARVTVMRTLRGSFSS